ncbi:MAG: hypothetical protein EA398_09125 [Deltaproteobacteria bacterium]|nr:MAG: hypothetical protein EA398_09125 [Deltaproteobacteria bacterium]
MKSVDDRFPLSPSSMPRLFLTFLILLTGLASACGLNESERAVADTNEAIRAVEQAGRTVADAIHALPESGLNHDSFGALRAAIGQYMGRMETLNDAVRDLRPHFERLVPHIDETFRPAAEAAASACQEATGILENPAADADAYRRAITRIGLCMDRYATAVTNVSNEYRRGSR